MHYSSYTRRWVLNETRKLFTYNIRYNIYYTVSIRLLLLLLGFGGNLQSERIFFFVIIRPKLFR